MSLQQWAATRVEQQTLPRLQPYYGATPDRVADSQSWRESRSIGFSERREEPTGFIASMGRLGLQVDSSDSGPRVNGLAWAPNESLSIVAGGNLGAGGIGASLSLRWRF